MDNLIKAGVVKEKLDGQPNRILLELWHQLKPEQQFQLLRSRTWKPEPKPHVLPVSLQDALEDSTQAPPGPSPHRRMVGHFGSTEGHGSKSPPWWM